MNEIDDKDFDQYLERSSGVSRQYRELPSEAVPPALDARVLAEARAAAKTGSKSKSRTLTRWSVPLALAASVVLVATVMLDSEMQERAAPGYDLKSSEAPAQENVKVSAASPPAAPPPAPASSDATAESAKPRDQFASEPKREAESVVVTGERARATPQDSPMPVAAISVPEPVVSVPEPPPPKLADTSTASAPASPAAQQVQVTTAQRLIQETRQDAAESARDNGAGSVRAESDQRRRALEEAIVTEQRKSAPPDAGPRGTITPARRSVSGLVRAPEWESDPRTWLEHIRELRKKDEDEKADAEWKRFVEAYPNFEVAESDAARPPRR